MGPMRRDHLAALFVRPRHQKVNRARTQIKAIEEHVHRHHHCDEAKPDRSHRASSVRRQRSFAGVLRIFRFGPAFDLAVDQE